MENENSDNIKQNCPLLTARNVPIKKKKNIDNTTTK